MEKTTDWQAVAVYLGMIYFIGKLIWDIVTYFLKKKDKLTDSDHEAIASIRISITEIRECQRSMLATVESIKVSVELIDGRVDGADEDVRNIQEALRLVDTLHKGNHPGQTIRLDEILKRKSKH